MSLEEQKLFTLSDAREFTSAFSGVCVPRSLIFCAVVFCRSLFVRLAFLFWPMYCLSFFKFTASDNLFSYIQTFLKVTLCIYQLINTLEANKSNLIKRTYTNICFHGNHQYTCNYIHPLRFYITLHSYKECYHRMLLKRITNNNECKKQLFQGIYHVHNHLL